MIFLGNHVNCYFNRGVYNLRSQNKRNGKEDQQQFFLGQVQPDTDKQDQESHEQMEAKIFLSPQTIENSIYGSVEAGDQILIGGISILHDVPIPQQIEIFLLPCA